MGRDFRSDHLPFPMPDSPHVLSQEWRNLTFMHWEVDPARLAPYIPEGLELDLFEGKAYVCLLYTSPSPRDGLLSRMPSSA